MSKLYEIVKFDEDWYPGWRGSISDSGLGIVFVNTRFNPEYKYVAMGKQTNNLVEAIRLASQFVLDKRKRYENS